MLPIAKSEGEEIFPNRQNVSNSQNLKLLKAYMTPELGVGTGGGEVVTHENALVAMGNLEENDTTVKIMNSGADEISVYIVREGDTLSQIAEMYDVKVSTIRGFNNIRKDSDLSPGDELLILPIDGVLYKVEKGDTLASVAKKWKSDETDIALFNDLPESGALSVGAEIIIPNAQEIEHKEETKVAVKASVKTAPKESSGGVGYDAYPSGFYSHPIPRGSVKSQGFHGPYQAQDLAAATGTSIVASSAGRVIAVRTGWSGGYGNMIIIDDGRANVLYAHMSEINVSQGQVVAQGELVGKVGSTGRSTGPHLHIEYRGKNGPMKTPVWK